MSELAKIGSARESVKASGFGWVFASRQFWPAAAAAVAVGMWKAAFCAAFPSSEGLDQDAVPSIPTWALRAPFPQRIVKFPASFAVLVLPGDVGDRNVDVSETPAE